MTTRRVVSQCYTGFYCRCSRLLCPSITRSASTHSMVPPFSWLPASRGYSGIAPNAVRCIWTIFQCFRKEIHLFWLEFKRTSACFTDIALWQEAVVNALIHRARDSSRRRELFKPELRNYRYVKTDDNKLTLLLNTSA